MTEILRVVELLGVVLCIVVLIACVYILYEILTSSTKD